MKKWSLRILISLLALVLLLAAAVQVVLWTDLPRNWVLSAIQEKLQLRVSAQRFSTGWSGRTQLAGVVVSLPLEKEQALLQTQELSIEHTSLLGLIFGRPLRVISLEIRKPNLLVRQSPNGRWNIEEVAELISRTGGGKTAETTPSTTSVPQLPKLTITDAMIRLIDLRGKQATLSPLAVTASPDGALVWRYDAVIPSQLHVVGQVAPGGSWQHEATIELSNLREVVRPFIANPSPPALSALEHFKLAGQWSGRIDGTLTGRLDLKESFPGRLYRYRAREHRLHPRGKCDDHPRRCRHHIPPERADSRPRGSKAAC